MFLAIDIGNSNITLALHNGSQWIEEWRTLSDKSADVTHYRSAFRAMFMESNFDFAQIRKAVLSSVVPQLTDMVVEVIGEYLGYRPVVLDKAIYPQLPIGIHNPEQIGTDLVANALSAYHKFQQACIVVDFGTALTFTTLDKEGNIIGVAIAPGLKTAIKALFHNTSQLPEIPIKVPESALGTDTETAIQSGIVLGYMGLVESMIQRIKAEVGTECKVAATGGLSGVVTPIHHLFDVVDVMLTSDGLRVIGDLVE